MIYLDADDKTRLIELLIPLPILADERAREAILFRANLEEFHAQIDCTGTAATAVPLLIRHLCTLGEISNGQTALGYFLNAVKEQVGKQQQVFLESLITKYSLLHPENIFSPNKGFNKITLEANSEKFLQDHGFRCIRKLGQGGFSDVYKAIESKTNAVKAIKFPKGNRDIQPEIELLQGLQSHRGIVPIEDILKYGEKTLLIMPYAGRTLKWHMQRKKIQCDKFEQILDWMKELLEVLIFVHKKGIIHKDIKPANLLIDEQSGRLRVTDFGIAEKIHYAEFKYSTIVRGTLCYMSPEQMLADNVNHQTDIYSFGAVFYELVTGEKPVGRFPDPSHYNSDLPLWLETIINTCLERDLSKRYYNTHAMLQELNYQIKNYDQYDEKYRNINQLRLNNIANELEKLLIDTDDSLNLERIEEIVKRHKLDTIYEHKHRFWRERITPFTGTISYVNLEKIPQPHLSYKNRKKHILSYFWELLSKYLKNTTYRRY